jgi:Zn-dependent membrane protease YugP
VLNIASYVLIGVGMLILLVCLSIASYAGSHMMETYEQINKHMSSSFTVASNFCAMVSHNYLDSKVKVGHKQGYLTDAYSPRRKVVFLSQQVFGNSSVAALTIAAHELGHAMQDKQDSQILKRRDTLSLVAKLLGIFMAPLLIAGVILFFAYPANLVYSVVCLAGGIGIFVLALVVKGLTISIEKDASSRAIMLLEQLQVLDEQEIKLAKKLLKAALLTYVADFLRAILGWTMLTQKTKLF